MQLRELQSYLRPCLIYGLLALLWVPQPAAAAHPGPAFVLVVAAAEATAEGSPGLDRSLHRVMVRAERSMNRFGSLFGQVALLWLSILVSAVAFLLVVAVSSVADFRVLDLRRHGPGAVSRYLGHGLRMFFRLLMDRRTPYLARSVLALALLYWLVPADLIADSPLFPGILDDLVIAVLAAKGFIYLCPDSLVTAHASAVQARA